MSITVTTRYVTVAHSNVGGYRATGHGKQRTNRCDQSLTADANHRAAARRLALAIVQDLGLDSLDEVVVEEVCSNDAGTERRWAVTR